jgi:hypothetical protein
MKFMFTFQVHFPGTVIQMLTQENKCESYNMETCCPNVKAFIKLKLNEIKTFTDTTGNWGVCTQMC